MRVVFFGSDDFAAAHLKDLIPSEFAVVGCVTQPDRPKGRGMKMNVSPIKEVAQEHDIRVLQPLDLKEGAFLQDLRELAADVFVVIAYGRFLPAELLQMPPQGAINLHPSLLPLYRGAAPINWAIIRGETMTGISIIRLNARMDAGDVIAQTEVTITPDDTAPTLREKMIPLGSTLLRETIARLQRGECVGRPQDPDRVTLAPKLNKTDGTIDWTRQSAGEIHNLVRGLLPWPSAHSVFQGKAVKFLATAVASGSGRPGEIITAGKESFSVAAREGAVQVLRLQPESGKAMSAAEFMRGYHVASGQRMGE